MTIEEYMKLGGQGRLNSDIIKLGYESKLKTLINRVGKIDYRVYKEGESFFIHFKIPSEKVDDLCYDSIIKIYPNSSKAYLQKSMSGSVKGFDFQYISNSPDFIYFYAYLFNKEGLLIDSLVDILPEECIHNKPDQNNKTSDLSSCKSLYWICILLEQFGLIRYNNLILKSSRYNIKEIKGDIVNFNTILKLRQNGVKTKSDNVNDNATDNKRTRPKTTQNNKLNNIDTKSFTKNKLKNTITKTKYNKSIKRKK